MNGIWLLLILFCCGGQNSCGNSRCGCGNGRRNSCNRCGSCEQKKEITCEAVCEAACEAACDAANGNNQEEDCGCRRNFPYTSYPVLDNCN